MGRRKRNYWCRGIIRRQRLGVKDIKRPKRDAITGLSDDDEANYLDADDYLFASSSDGGGIPTRPSVANPLMPANVQDETTARETFIREFATRYGEIHPQFFGGTLVEAIRSALHAPSASQRKPLIVYLHHHNSISVNVFCSQVLCDPDIVDFITRNFVIYPWDVTDASNRQKLQMMLERDILKSLGHTIRTYNAEKFPLLVVITRISSTYNIEAIVEGSSSASETRAQLCIANDNFHENIKPEIQSELEQRERQEIKDVQNEEYQMSLLADRMKQEEKQKAEQERLKQLEQQRLHELDLEEKRQKALEKVSAEPSASCGKDVTNIRFRLPGGETLTRRFLADSPLEDLLHFVVSKKFYAEKFVVKQVYPPRCLSDLNKRKTLKQLNLYPSETLIIEANEED